MKNTFKIRGMTCQNCVATIRELLVSKSMKNISVQIGQADFDSETGVSSAELNEWLKPFNKYSVQYSGAVSMAQEETKPFFVTYKPLVLVFSYIILLVGMFEILQGGFDGMRFMNHFMGGFFVFFSFFKFLDLEKFADAYGTYDIIAKKSRTYGLIYPFLELGLGLVFLSGKAGLITNVATLLLMAVSSIGVIQSLLEKRTIQCACLGTAFNLPMTKVTFFEDGLMVVMAGISVVHFLVN